MPVLTPWEEWVLKAIGQLAWWGLNYWWTHHENKSKFCVQCQDATLGTGPCCDHCRRGFYRVYGIRR